MSEQTAEYARQLSAEATERLTPVVPISGPLEVIRATRRLTETVTLAVTHLQAQVRLLTQERDALRARVKELEWEACHENDRTGRTDP